MHSLLDKFLTPEFEADTAASTPSALRLRLRKAPVTRSFRDAYDSGEITDDALRVFVNHLLGEFNQEQAFPYQTALAAIAVMLEHRFSRFAEEYLIDLARVRTRRFSIASRVARACLKHRRAGTSNEVREFPPLGEQQKCSEFFADSNLKASSNSNRLAQNSYETFEAV